MARGVEWDLIVICQALARLKIVDLLGIQALVGHCLVGIGARALGAHASALVNVRLILALAAEWVQLGCTQAFV